MSGRPAANAAAKCKGARKARQAAPAKAKQAGNDNDEEKPKATLNNAIYNHSAARAQIAQDIIDDYIPKTGPFDSKEIFDTLYANDKRFENFPYNKDTYDRRIKSLRKGISDNLKEANDDHAAALEDLLKHPPKDKNIRGQFRWEGSAAERLLEQDIIDKLHEGVCPELFQATRNEYLLFDLNVFRKQIHQVVLALKPHHKKDKQKKRKKRHFGDNELSRKEKEGTDDDANDKYQTKKCSLSSKLVAQSNK